MQSLRPVRRVAELGSLGCDMKSRSSLLGAAQFGLDQALLFAAGIPREQAFGGRRKLLPRVWSLPGNVVNLEASIRVSALESDGRVK